MSEDTAGFGGAATGNGELGAEDMPVVGIISQYVKDLSFENPNAPAIFQTQGQPRIDVQFNIAAQQVGDDVHEVVLKIDARSEIDGKVAFVVDLAYAGLFAVRNIPAEHLQPFMLAEAPRLIFPFARRVLADAVRDGGFPPLMLDPIDFGALYMQQAQGQIEGDGGTPVGHA
ncbi:MAG: protein-export chaperone SecB [Sphingomonas sp.]|uniref:protein-export chaperone SecB n=1 Tax=Sphingomonas sp. TaxID=28214 RepID=UPI0025CEFF53|nr:protein-export chaperone SecB [Sphingomonas sp.]MBX9883052.1 protein-export chaperone SecB [Sphingomonas sp.]